MKKLTLITAAAALSLSACAGSTEPSYYVEGVPFEEGNKTCITITAKAYDGDGFFDLDNSDQWTQVFCIDTVKLDLPRE